jgi:hypothetical protein
MATNSTLNKKSVRNTLNGQNAMGIQRKINDDYAELLKDYGKLFVELWRKPMTKYILGGLALSVIPFLMNQKKS